MARGAVCLGARCSPVPHGPAVRAAGRAAPAPIGPLRESTSCRCSFRCRGARGRPRLVARSTEERA
eukprot:11191091-Lingulodinium_polyedra.AAC.1